MNSQHIAITHIEVVECFPRSTKRRDQARGGMKLPRVYHLLLEVRAGAQSRCVHRRWVAYPNWEEAISLAECVDQAFGASAPINGQSAQEVLEAAFDLREVPARLRGVVRSALSELAEPPARVVPGPESPAELYARIIGVVSRLHRSGSGQRAVAGPTQPVLLVERVVAILHEQKVHPVREAGTRDHAETRFQVELHVRTSAGRPMAFPFSWTASSGWERVEASIERLIGIRVPEQHAQAVPAIAQALEALSQAGFPSRRLEVVGTTLASAVSAAIEPAGYGAAPLDYPRILPGVKRYVSFPLQPMPTWQGRPMNIYHGVTYLHPLGGNGAKGHLLERQALAYGLSTLRYNKGTFLAGDGSGQMINFKWSRSPISSCVSLALCTHKEATRARLHRAGVPVPRGRMFVNGDFDSAYPFAKRIGYPVVCKPVAGVRGIGVVANIQDESELTEAFRQYSNSRLGSDDFIIEKHVPGRDYRIIVLDGKVIAAILREPASVVGDGRHNIAELVMHKNAIRRLNPHLWARPAKYDDAMRFQLQRAGLTLQSVPEPGRTIMLSNSCSLSQGGDSIDVLEELHPSIRDASIAAVEAIPGLRYCGVDFLIEDHTLPIEGQSAGICELNAHAAIGNCEYPLFGQPREVARQFLHLCATEHGLRIHETPAQTLALRLVIRGKVTRVNYRAWMQGQAKRFGVQGWVRNLDARTVEAVLVGDTAPVSAMATGAVLGSPRALPTSVQTEHIGRPEVDGFRIMSSDTEDLVNAD